MASESVSLHITLTSLLAVLTSSLVQLDALIDGAPIPPNSADHPYVYTPVGSKYMILASVTRNIDSELTIYINRNDSAKETLTKGVIRADSVFNGYALSI